MKVKELMKHLQELPPDDEIIITAMDDQFLCNNFEIHSPYDDEQAQELIMNVYIDSYEIGE